MNMRMKMIKLPVGTVVIPIADPYSRNALVIAAALILIRRAGQRWAILFVFTKRTVDVTIAALIKIDASIS